MKKVQKCKKKKLSIYPFIYSFIKLKSYFKNHKSYEKYKKYKNTKK